MEYTTDATVIGAGVIGLAIGRALAQRGMETVVLDQANCIGSETSSRNSEVIHAGIYYPPGSGKAKYCVKGKKMLYQYLHERQLPYSRCGKLIVARHAEEKNRLNEIAARARDCGVDDLTPLSQNDVNALEPQVEAQAGLFSPSTGILDSHQFMLSLQGDIEASGGIVALSSPVTGGELNRSGRHLVQSGGEDTAGLRSHVVINAAGLWARETWLALSNASDTNLAPAQFYAKGHYYSYSGKAPFSHLVYPLPEPGGLGVHATIDLGGQVRFGPDVRWTDSVNYDFDDSQRNQFIKAIRRYFPSIEAERLQPAYTGIRPKLSSPGALDSDFTICTERYHGIPGYVGLHGIESPGLTASLAIADAVAAYVTSS